MLTTTTITTGICFFSKVGTLSESIVTVEEEHSITRVAERLHIAQSSLTQSIRKIETELGCSLFTRRNMVLLQRMRVFYTLRWLKMFSQG